VEDRYKSHTDDTDLVYGLTHRRENFEVDTFDYNGYKENTLLTNGFQQKTQFMFH